VTSWYHEAQVLASAMSSNAGQGSGSKSDDMIAAILKQLAAMNERLRSMESKLHNVYTMQVKVSALEESTDELDA
jgi:queuine/archaeosine tRNA-ribosyltransferase